MAAGPQRREQRKTHLDASVAPVERALLDRANTLSGETERYEANAERLQASGDLDGAHFERLLGQINVRFAGEFRALAEELHYW